LTRFWQIFPVLIISLWVGYALFSSSFYNQITKYSASSSRSERSILTTLPWSRYEVNEISNYISGDSYLGENASEFVFKQEAGTHGIIHIATHAFTDDEYPSYSRLVFNNGGGPAEDGILYAYEIYNLKLNSDLAVLSSCNTGTGKFVKGEGTFSLARAFIYAGVPSVVMSLWNIDDRSTAEIVVGFYKRLEQGETKTDALRNAKLEYLKKSDQLTANPVYWAGLIPIGDQSSINVKKPVRYYYLVIITAAFLLFIFIMNKRSSIIHSNTAQNQ